MKLMHDPFNAMKDLASSFHHWDVLWRSCRVFECRPYRTKPFNPVGYLVKLMHDPFNAMKDLASSFHHWDVL